MPTHIYLIPNQSLSYEDSPSPSSSLFVQFSDGSAGSNYSYEISGIPTGWSYEINESSTAPQIPPEVIIQFDAAAGTLTFTNIPADFALYNFQLTPPEHSDEDATNLTATATITNNSGNIIEQEIDNSTSTSQIVDAVADDVDLSIDDITDATGPVELDLLAALQDNDGSETITGYTITGIPVGFTFQDQNGDPIGTDLGGGVWELDPSLIGNVTLIPTVGFNGDITLIHSITNEEGVLINLTNYNENLEFDDSNNSNTGTITQSIHFTDCIVCFAADTLISTPNGEEKINNLDVGDMVNTVDNGTRPIKWISSRHIPLPDIQLNEKLRPIVIGKWSIGNNLPANDLIVSPNHRMVIENWKAEILFGETQILAPAKSLVGVFDGVRKATDKELTKTNGITYCHMLFDDNSGKASHEIVIAEGAKSESFHPGAHTLNDIFSKSAQEEIFDIFPELRFESSSPITHARPSLKPHEVLLLK